MPSGRTGLQDFNVAAHAPGLARLLLKIPFIHLCCVSLFLHLEVWRPHRGREPGPRSCFEQALAVHVGLCHSGGQMPLYNILNTIVLTGLRRAPTTVTNFKYSNDKL